MLIYLTTDHLIALHRRVIAETGGPPGVRELGGVQSALARPFASYGGQALYPTLEEKAAALAEGISRNHPFVDGNKRMAIAAGCLFLMLNGREITATEQELEHTAWALAVREIELADLAEWFRSHSKAVE
ncbi:death-on-curing protein [Symbiobacterium terraclitae]|uniref:Death-on-curing protein n=1 Tax=Symbiobacterium terraclitae TaxID=557451 RepID=A0ABS4JTC0_9FIRM|nr:type II toxin-antitoxin system death-on-curing family toxin [Symbiobacterium terraclitae]MBP2018791.1 death-on-curing protein [Symbiobacterium terraclitae]